MPFYYRYIDEILLGNLTNKKVYIPTNYITFLDVSVLLTYNGLNKQRLVELSNIPNVICSFEFKILVINSFGDRNLLLSHHEQHSENVFLNIFNLTMNS